MIRSVLMVCEGNICRSPLAAALLAQAMPGIEVGSAGTHALTGQPADPQAVELMRARGIDLSGHVARPASSVLLRRHDLILVMALGQRETLLARHPFARGRVYRLMHAAQRDVGDPYRQGRAAFEAALTHIESGLREWLGRLRPASHATP
ncbi:MULTISPECIES: low molecular weight protein-tyrosine-phosphatase [unclassified Caballeronia]|uniref:low molecular weight protein-tyrosine-phosphatase n=1 Tax=unclassified Caballeronia TaxID=2646786 RepID=UPI002862B8F2|nr:MULTISPECIES: low molecular weight protein-tyrosine-phosphatase [unclassified Caballeronia]MDR5814791.1 low molecular weight phosphotyrosine protein phosphatase [Caballeronia sp. LZ033]MDR5821272.1 low molecular weight phosphotyrosine protein phosphatase [Caballeronia sp. LZ043]